MPRRAKKIIYNKLVRDRIPEIITKDGWEPTVRTLTLVKLSKALKEKIVEEASELLRTKKKQDVIEELADLEECIDAFRHAEGIPGYVIERTRREKQRKRGGFSKRIFLVSTKRIYGKAN